MNLNKEAMQGKTKQICMLIISEALKLGFGAAE
jgi:hypothetical protein